MSDLQTEAEVRDAFRRLSAEVPAAAGDRLRLVDYRPRSTRVPWTVGAVSGGVATASVVVSVVVLGGAPPAFAGWSATPAAGGVQTASAAVGCQGELASPAAGPVAAPSGPWTTVLTDVRGPYAVVVYSDGNSFATCFSGPTFTVVTRRVPGGAVTSMTGSGGRASGETSFGSSGGVGIVETGSGTAGITGMSESHLVQAGDGAYSMVEGQVASDVTGVTLVRSDETDVEATVGNGWVVAWWPGTLDAVSAQVKTPTGTTTEKLDGQAPPPPAPGGGSVSTGNS